MPKLSDTADITLSSIPKPLLHVRNERVKNKLTEGSKSVANDFIGKTFDKAGVNKPGRLKEWLDAQSLESQMESTLFSVIQSTVESNLQPPTDVDVKTLTIFTSDSAEFNLNIPQPRRIGLHNFPENNPHMDRSNEVIELFDSSVPVNATVTSNPLFIKRWKDYLAKNFLTDPERDLYLISRMKIYSDVESKIVDGMMMNGRYTELMLPRTKEYRRNIKVEDGFSDLRIVYDTRPSTKLKRSYLKEKLLEKMRKRKSDHVDGVFEEMDVGAVKRSKVWDQGWKVRNCPLDIVGINGEVPIFEWTRLVLPEMSLLRSISNVSSYIFTSSLPPCSPHEPTETDDFEDEEEPPSLLHSFDGTSLMAFGILLQEFARYMIMDERDRGRLISNEQSELAPDLLDVIDTFE
ncbi:hypothetical protein HK098_000353 [Nowakowskiella sp. JEL0407]|nr:hypothetical protein HK098_000353 [Nowakowskiella sp. JEL0407]